MKKFLALLLSLVMVLAIVACGDKKDDSADNSDGDTASGRVYWLNFKPEADEALQKVAAMYTEKTGVPVTVVTAASGTYNETLTAEMDKSAPPTLFVVGNQAAVDTWGDYCYDLSGTAVANELNTDAYNLYDADGKLCSIGYCYEAFGIIVNKALLKQAGYEISDITNFETLKKVADDIQARFVQAGEAGYGLHGGGGRGAYAQRIRQVQRGLPALHRVDKIALDLVQLCLRETSHQKVYLGRADGGTFPLGHQLNALSSGVCPLVKLTWQGFHGKEGVGMAGNGQLRKGIVHLGLGEDGPNCPLESGLV